MFSKAIIVSLVLISLLGFYPQRSSAEPQIILTPQEYISLYARQYGASEKQLLVVAQCESKFKPTAVGDKGAAKNIFQYHQQTFEAFSLLVGEKLDYNSYQDQAKLTAIIFAKYPKLRSHWTCFNLNYKKI